jgi:hypothetical protein
MLQAQSVPVLRKNLNILITNNLRLFLRRICGWKRCCFLSTLDYLFHKAQKTDGTDGIDGRNAPEQKGGEFAITAGATASVPHLQMTVNSVPASGSNGRKTGM